MSVTHCIVQMRFGQSAMASAGWTSSWKGLQRGCLFVFALGAVSGAVVRAQEMTYREPKIHEVGGPGVNWTIPRSATFFQDWASNISFRAGDVLEFNRPAKGDIAEIYENEAYYDGCNTTEYGYTHLWTNDGTSKIFAKLDSSLGIHYFIHVSPSNCTKGLQFAATEEEVTIPDPPQQPLTTSKLQGRGAQRFDVGGDGSSWSVPVDKKFYINWASNMSFRKGDEIRFGFVDPAYKVSEVVDYEAYESCTADEPLWTATAVSIRIYTFETTGVHYFVASGPVQYCVQGMKLAAFVYCEDGTICSGRHKESTAEKTISLISSLVVTTLVLLCCGGILYQCLHGKNTETTQEAELVPVGVVFGRR